MPLIGQIVTLTSRRPRILNGSEILTNGALAPITRDSKLDDSISAGSAPLTLASVTAPVGGTTTVTVRDSTDCESTVFRKTNCVRSELNEIVKSEDDSVVAMTDTPVGAARTSTAVARIMTEKQRDLYKQVPTSYRVAHPAPGSPDPYRYGLKGRQTFLH